MNETKISLQLGKIVLKNYKTYKGDTTIDLSRDLQKTITVIHGEMGHGKTTILEAIYWCLYGENRLANIESDEGIINSDILHNLKINDLDETVVEIYLYEENELRYKIKRVMEFSKQNDSTDLIKNSTIGGRIPAGITLNAKIEFGHLPRGSSDWNSYNVPEKTQNAINNLIPKSLSKYFLFDAELLDNFFDITDEKNKVKDGIEKISGLPIIENTIRHLKKTSEHITKNIIDPKSDPIKNEVDLLKRKIQVQESKIKAEHEKQNKLNTEIETIEAFLRTHNEDTIKTTQKRIEELKKDMQDNKKRLTEHKGKMIDWVLRENIMMRLNESMNKSLEKCNVWEQEGKIPIAVSSLALKNILKNKPPICICGAHLDAGTNEREHIEKLLEKNLIDSPIIQNITVGRGYWESMTSEIQTADENFKKFKADRDEINTIDHNKYEEKKLLEKKYEDINLEDVKKKFQDLKELRNELHSSHQELGSAKAENDKAKRELELKNRDLERQLRQDNKYASQGNRIILANTLAKIFKKYHDELRDELRSTVTKKTTEYFLKLVSRKDDFSEVQIQENYKTLAFDKNRKIKSLSAGQSCCLALSFIAAIRETAEKNYFMLIDSPLHNISQEERVDIAKNLPKFLPQTQITLLVQDQEYTGHANKGITGDEIPSVRDTLMANGSIWKEYVLKTRKEDNSSSHTVIEDVSL